MTENTGFEAYKLYSSLKLHFTSTSYDFFKYNGKTNVSADTFMKRKDKYHFYRLSRKYTLEELRDFYVSNFIVDSNSWVGNILGPEGEENYRKWQKRIQSLTYNFEQDIIKLLDSCVAPEDMLKVNHNQFPMLLTEVMRGSTSLETVIILNDIMNFFPMWKKKIDDDIVWPNWALRCEKYAPFVFFDKPKFKNLLKELIIEHA
jgi:hypothetical protein